MTAEPVTVLVVDDEVDMRDLVRLVLEASGAGLEVVGEAVDGDEALAVFSRLDPPPVPTVVILDNQMPGRTGVEVAAEIRRQHPEQRIVLFSAFLTPELRAAADEAGVDACVGKNDLRRLPGIVVDLATGTARA